MIGESVPNKAMTAPEWGLLLTLSVLWGGSFFFVAVAVDELPPLTVVVLRVSLAALALLGESGSRARGCRPTVASGLRSLPWGS